MVVKLRCLLENIIICLHKYVDLASKFLIKMHAGKEPPSYRFTSSPLTTGVLLVSTGETFESLIFLLAPVFAVSSLAEGISGVLPLFALLLHNTVQRALFLYNDNKLCPFVLTFPAKTYCYQINYT